jgi:RNA recognition motif-containing protein
VEFKERELISYMDRFGPVREVRLHRKPNGESKGFAFVYFKNGYSV